MFLFTGFTWAQSGTDARNMNIPSTASELDSLEKIQSMGPSQPQIRLHYNLGLLDRFSSYLYFRTGSSSNDSSQYQGVEPSFFSKPSESLYRVPIGWFGSDFKKAISDNSEAKRIMAFYYLRKTATVLMLAGSMVTGTLTFVGLQEREYFFGEYRNSHILFGAGLTFGLVGGSIIPELFNRGKIRRAAQIYNKSYN